VKVSNRAGRRRPALRNENRRGYLQASPVDEQHFARGCQIAHVAIGKVMLVDDMSALVAPSGVQRLRWSRSGFSVGGSSNVFRRRA
jgi:hypothetical protein